MKSKICGVITALATPYKGGKVDLVSYAKLIEKQLESGIDGLLCLGTTAEPSLLTGSERKTLLKLTVNAAKSKVPILCGAGSASTQETVRLSRQAELYGADALLIAPPPFSKCTPNGYVQHINTILKNVNIPVVLYNVPSRAAYSLPISAVSKCLKLGAAAIKDATEGGEYAQRLCKLGSVFCGSDENTIKYTKIGACGTISVVSNICPILTKKVFYNICTQTEKNIFSLLCKACFEEVSPIPIKYALKKCEIFDSCQMRLPLTSAKKSTRQSIDSIFEKYAEYLK